MNLISIKTTALLALALLAGGAHAQAGTGSLAGWASYGDTIAQSGAITLTTAFLDGAGDQPFNLSGNPAVDIGAVESGAGVAPYALDLSAEQFGTEGSLVQQSFAVLAGQALSFQWTFATQETLFEDHAFAVIDGQVFTLATRSAPGGGTQTFSHLFTQAGTVSLAIGVIDTGDYLGVSSLSIQGLQVSSVPEPQTLAMLLAGLAAVGRAARRRRR